MAGAHELSQLSHDDVQQEELQADASHGAEQHEEHLSWEQSPAKVDDEVMANTTIAKSRFFRIRCILQT